MIKLIGIVIVFFVSVVAFAQPGKASVETVDGKKYFVHFIEQGQTLYGLHQMYSVPVGDIARANNDLKEGLQIGQKILIPISVNDSNYYTNHIVVKGETLYGISKKYKCIVNDLKNLNPELNAEGLSIGQVLKVPNVEIVNQSIQKPGIGETLIQEPQHFLENLNPISKFKDSIITHTVLKHETLYSISKRYMVSINEIRILNNISKNSVSEGDKLKIKVKKVNYSIVENNINANSFDSTLLFKQNTKKESYKIALFLPLMLSKNQSYLDKPIRVGKVKELYSTTNISSSFYHGFILAADSLTKAGLNVEILVYDTQKDTLKIEQYLNKSEFSNIDLVVGPFYPKTINYMANYCKQNKIKMIIPFKVNPKVLDHSPTVYKATISNLGLVNGMMDFVAKNMSSYNVVIVKPTRKSDLVLYDAAIDKYNTSIVNIESPMTSKIIELKIGNANGRDLNIHLRKDTLNVVIVPSSDVKFVTGVFVRLNSVLNLNAYSKNMKIIVFGLEDWNKMKDIDLKHRMRLNQHYATYRFLDYEAKKTNHLIKSYRHEYGTDPSVYAVQGFDVGYYFLSALQLYGTDFNHYLKYHKVDLVQNDFSFDSGKNINGKENRSVFIVKYSDYQLKMVK